MHYDYTLMMNDHNILQCAIHMVHGWSLPPTTCKQERKIARIISRRITRDDIYEKLAVYAADNVTDALHEMSHTISFDRIVSTIGYVAYLHHCSKEGVLQDFVDFYDTVLKPWIDANNLWPKLLSCCSLCLSTAFH